jgi:hypothetical protein
MQENKMKQINGKWTLKDCFEYFTNAYQKHTGKKYFYFRKHLGLELMKIKRLGLKPEEFVRFINWLCDKKKIASLNFLSGQLNDYYSSKDYQDSKQINKALLHDEIMALKKRIVESCKKCNGIGYLDNNATKCECMKKFIKLRDEIRSKNESNAT